MYEMTHPDGKTIARVGEHQIEQCKRDGYTNPKKIDPDLPKASPTVDIKAETEELPPVEMASGLEALPSMRKAWIPGFIAAGLDSVEKIAVASSKEIDSVKARGLGPVTAKEIKAQAIASVGA